MAYIPNNNGHEENKDKSVYKQLFNASTVGMALVSGMLVGGAIGYFLDKWLGTSPWLLFIFLILKKRSRGFFFKNKINFYF